MESKTTKKIKKVFMPKWMRWFVTPLFIGIWGLITYLEFFSPANKDELGVIGYLIMSAIFLGLGIVMWLMASGKLPAYIIEEDD